MSETKIDPTPPQPSRPGAFWIVLRIPMFFAGCGTLLGVIAFVTPCLVAAQVSGWRGRPGMLMMMPPLPVVAVMMAILGAMAGAFWVGACSIVSIPYLRRTRLWGRTTWLLPAHCLGIMVGEYILVGVGHRDGVWIPLFVGGASFVYFYVLYRKHLPYWHIPGCCDECEYDLTGNTSGVCPECGTPVPNELAGEDVK